MHCEHILKISHVHLESTIKERSWESAESSIMLLKQVNQKYQDPSIAIEIAANDKIVKHFYFYVHRGRDFTIVPTGPDRNIRHDS